MRRGIVAVEQHNGIRHIIHWRSPLAANPDIGACVCFPSGEVRVRAFLPFGALTRQWVQTQPMFFFCVPAFAARFKFGCVCRGAGTSSGDAGRDTVCARRRRRPLRETSLRASPAPVAGPGHTADIIIVDSRETPGTSGPSLSMGDAEPAAPPRLGTPANRRRRAGSADSRGAQNRGRSRHDGGALLHPRHRAHTRVYGHYFPFGGLSAPATAAISHLPPSGASGKLAREDIYDACCPRCPLVRNEYDPPPSSCLSAPPTPPLPRGSPPPPPA